MTLLGDKPWLWVLIAAVLVLLHFLVALVDNILKGGNGVGRRFWKRHIIDEDPFPAACQKCNRGDCIDCKEVIK